MMPSRVPTIASSVEAAIAASSLTDCILVGWKHLRGAESRARPGGPILSQWVGSALGAIRAGVDGYLVKPCDITELKATLTRGRERVERAAAERAALLGAVAEARERLTVVIEHLPVGVILAEAPSGRLLLGNRAVERIWRQPFPGATDAGQRAGARGFHVDGRPYLPEDWPLA